MTKPTDVVYVHVPQEGRFVIGIPARDLTQQDVDRLGETRIHAAVATGLYEPAKKAPAQPEKAPAKTGEGDER
mgnify:CR=1 FL=1|jgi:hypothetical protein